MKTCIHCGAEKALDEFPLQRRTRDGHSPWCRRCHTDAVLAWQRRNPDKYRANLDRQAARRRRPPRPRLSVAEKQAHVSAYMREYNARPEVRARREAYKARRTSDGVRLDTVRKRWRIGDRDGWRCGICARPVDRLLAFPNPLSGLIDHTVPVALGGSNAEANLQIAHLICNWRKGAGREVAA